MLASFRRYQLLGLLFMVAAVWLVDSPQIVLLLLGSGLIALGLAGRIYLLTVVFQMPAVRITLRHIITPVAAFLIAARSIGVMPPAVAPALWYYLLAWSGAALGMTLFLLRIRLRLAALELPPGRRRDS